VEFGIVGYGLGSGRKVVFAGRKVVVVVEQCVGRQAVAVVELHAEDEMVEDLFDRPDLHLEKILQVQSAPGSVDPKVSKLVAEEQTVAVGEKIVWGFEQTADSG